MCLNVSLFDELSSSVLLHPALTIRHLQTYENTKLSNKSTHNNLNWALKRYVNLYEEVAASIYIYLKTRCNGRARIYVENENTCIQKGLGEAAVIQRT